MVKFTYRDGVLAAIKHVANTPWKSRQATVTGLRELANTCPSCDTAWTAKEDLPCPKCGSNNSDELVRELVGALTYMMHMRCITCLHRHPAPDESCAKCKADSVLAKANAIDAEEK